MDSLINLAFSMYHNKGVYALLLGSGISKSANIPTGWDIEQDLVKQINAIGGNLQQNMGYDELLKELGKTPAERNSFLRQYFEPTDDDRQNNLKVPTLAHRSIAGLVQSGYIRVILTTNFDQLLETALRDIGINPDVISSDDMIQGARPLVHSPITIIKVHGDYQDIRTLNTQEELSQYSQLKNDLLDQIFDHYGLIICGWSATWDTALRNAIYRCPSQRYSTYWVEPFPLSSDAGRLIQHRQSNTTQLTADDFFKEIYEKVQGLEKLNAPHPLSGALAAERVKKLLPYETSQIELEDFLRRESERAFTLFQNYSPPQIQINDENDYMRYYTEVLEHTTKIIETPLTMLVALCWYGKNQQANMIIEILHRWSQSENLSNPLVGSKLIPPLLFIYACGIAALSKQNWLYLRNTLIEVRLDESGYSNAVPLLYLLTKHEIVRPHSTNWRKDPISIPLRSLLWQIYQTYIPREKEFNRQFDLFEMIMCVIFRSLDEVSQTDYWIEHDAATHRYSDYDRNAWEHIKNFWANGAAQNQNWGLLEIIFNGNRGILCEALTQYDTLNVKRGNARGNSPIYHEIYCRSGVRKYN